jgi:hypothetical protein
LYEWFTDGTSYYWIDKLSQPVAVSFASQATPPIGAKTGDLWYDTSSDTLYTYVYDGTTYYWVDYSTTPSSVAGIGALIANVTVGNIIASSIQSNVAASTSITTASSVGYLGIPVNSQGSSYTLALTDQGKQIYFTASSQTVTVPPYSSVAFPVGAVATIILNNTNSMSITAGGGVTITLAGNTTAKSTWTLGSNGICTLLNVAQNVWFASGTLT